jgi:endogenous inhibitor of DNA gyrase (YacG/DUF329 family)
MLYNTANLYVYITATPDTTIFCDPRRFRYDNELLMLLVKCPTCGKKVEFEGNEFRPFCSERCNLLDFGAWADEEYNLPAETSEMTEEDIEALEKELEKKS